MEKPEALKRFVEVILGERHKNYKHTVDKAELYRALATGDGMEKLLKRFVMRESEQLFKQRVQLTQHIVSTVIKNISDPFQKVPRSKYVKAMDYAKGNKKASLKSLDEITSQFFAGRSVEAYLANRLIELNIIDPNTFIIVEFKNFDSNKEFVKPYPFEATSSMVIDYKYEKGVLDSIFVESDGSYYCYLANMTLVAEKVKEEDMPKFAIPSTLGDNKPTWVAHLGEMYLRVNDKQVYKLKEPAPHNLGFVPAFKAGYIRDLQTNGDTAVSIFDAAIPYLLKSVKVNSEFDLTMSLIIFPQKISYEQQCDAPHCFGGIIADGTTCQTCEGTGVKKATTVAEEITIPIPRNKEDMIDLNSLIAFKSPDLSVVTFQDAYIDKLTQRAKRIVFNSDLYDKAEVAATATGKNIDLQSVYDVLFPFATHFSEVWVNITKAIAGFADLGADLVVKMVFPKDFKMKSAVELMQELALAQTSGASPEVKEYIQNDIVNVMYNDDEFQIRRYKTRQSFNPFSGFSSMEIMAFLGSELTTKRNKLLFANLGNIFSSIEDEYSAKGVDFYGLPRKEQGVVVDKYLDAIVAKIKEEAPPIQIPQ